MRLMGLLLTTCLAFVVGCEVGGRTEAKRAEPAADPAPSVGGASTSPHALPGPDETPADGGHGGANPHAAGGIAAPPAASGGAGRVADGKLELDRLTFTVPEGWQEKPASSTFLLAEFTLPKAEGDAAEGRLTVSTAGGTVEANIERWRGQFGGHPEKSSQSEETVNGIKVTVVELTGEFSEQRGPFAPATKNADYTMLAAIIPVDGELHFVKATGPKATIAAHAERFRAFVGSATKK